MRAFFLVCVVRGCRVIYSANSVPCYCGQCGPIPDGVRPTPCLLAWCQNDRGVRDPEQAVERHREDEQAYVRGLRAIGQKGA
jgi:hypothetical protein